MDVTTHEDRAQLDVRLDKVEEERGWTDRAWSLAAGLSEGYLKQQRLRARRSASFRLPEDGAEALARAAGVSAEWLRSGRGPREGPSTGSGPSRRWASSCPPSRACGATGAR